MNVPTITMPRDEAQQRLDEYRKSVSRRADAEHEAAVQAYEALAAGTPLLSLQQAFRRLWELEADTTGAGFDEQHRPRIAVARADRQHVCLVWQGSSTALTIDTHRNRGRYSETLVRRIDLGRRHGQTHPDFVDESKTVSKALRGYALVPMLPADVRNRMAERGPGGPEKHFILWDVEAWSDKPVHAQPDRDPLLLYPIGDAATTDLYAVVDEWDLTEVERYVMLGRRQA